MHHDLPPATITEPVDDGTKATVQRSNRIRHPSWHLRDSIESHMVQVYESIFMDNNDPVTNEHPLSALAASNDPDILNLSQAMKVPDAAEFQKSMAQEFNAHCNKKHWTFVLQSSLPPGTKVLPAVWAMRCKRRIATGEVYKWKARLNIHGGHQVKGIHYWDTYSPMVCWASIQLALTLSIIHGWHTAQMDLSWPIHRQTLKCHYTWKCLVESSAKASSQKRSYLLYIRICMVRNKPVVCGTSI